MEYAFKEGEENKPANERTIVKTGHVIEFTMVEMEHDLIKFDKTLRELRANLENRKQIIDNMEQHHPYLKDMPEFDRYTVHMYQENAAMAKALIAKIDEIEKEETDYKAEIAEIKETLPDLAVVPSPMANTAEGVVEAPVEEKTEDTTNDQKE